MTGSLPGTENRRRIYLLRHGQAAYFDAEGRPIDEPDLAPLTANGREEARRMGRALATAAIDRAYHTGLTRTRETAGIVLSGREVPLAEEPALREIRSNDTRAQAGGINLQAFSRAFDCADAEARFLGGERIQAFHDRVVAAAERLLQRDDWSRCLLVCHGGTNRALLSWAVGGSAQTMGAFEQDTCCLNIIDVDVNAGRASRRILRAANVTPANPAKDGLYATTLETLFRRLRGVAQD